MKQWTTPIHEFTIPVSKVNIKSVAIVYAQNNRPVVTVTTPRVVVEDNLLTVELTQEETGKFSTKLDVAMQVCILAINGRRYNSEIIHTDVENCLHRAVMK